MSAFTDFVQLELPKRPYMDTDSSTETVLIRRGAGPRQLTGLSLNDGEVLGKVGGVLQGVASSSFSSGTRFEQSTPSASWTITHNRGDKKAVVQVFDANDDLITPDNVRTNTNDIVITFGIAFTGYANILFF